MLGLFQGDDVNILKTPLSKILSHSEYTREFESTLSDLKEREPECEARAHCGSGCRASAIGADGADFLALDQRTCLVCKEDWAGKIRQAFEASKHELL